MGMPMHHMPPDQAAQQQQLGAGGPGPGVFAQFPPPPPLPQHGGMMGGMHEGQRQAGQHADLGDAVLEGG